MKLQIAQFGLTAKLDFKLFGPGPASFIERVKTDQHGPALQAAHQIAQTVQFIQHIRALFEAFGFAFDQMQAVGPDQADIDLVPDHGPASRLATDGDVAGDILYAAGLFQVKAQTVSVHFQPAAVGGKAGVFIGEPQGVAVDLAQPGGHEQFQQFPKMRLGARPFLNFTGQTRVVGLAGKIVERAQFAGITVDVGKQLLSQLPHGLGNAGGFGDFDRAGAIGREVVIDCYVLFFE